MSADRVEHTQKYRQWLASLKDRDPQLYDALIARIPAPSRAAGGLAGVTDEAPAAADDIVIETIVRDGRPALLTRAHWIVPPATAPDHASAIMIQRVTDARTALAPMIPLVGRIDVANHPSHTFVGTGWLFDDGVVVTNRHVADMIAKEDRGAYRFKPGRFGEELVVTLDYRHEFGDAGVESIPIERVIWIEPNAKKADIAFLKIAAGGSGGRPSFIPLAATNASPDADVAVVGYPARAPSHIIPDQARMDAIYGGTYDVKRVAPGKMGAMARGWATHDCTTLGGNSGSVVLDMKTGEAVALHFAGLYMVENYAVSAAVLQAYRKDRPWHPSGAAQPPRAHEPRSRPAREAGSAGAQAAAPTGAGTVTVTIPLTLSITLGQPQTGNDIRVDVTRAGGGGAAAGGTTVEAAAAELRRELRVPGVVDAWPGYQLADGRLTDDPCIVVSAHPDRVEEVRSAAPAMYGGVAVDVRPASVLEQLQESAPELIHEAVTSISYNDDDRTGENFSFAWIKEPMDLVLHVGPERSWEELKRFLGDTGKALVSSMYEFHAGHIAEALQARLHKGMSLKMVLGGQSRDHGDTVPDGDFERVRTFARWEEQWPNKFSVIFVPTGTEGLVANAYHIKVSVGDNDSVWLSSGNWKKTSQPLIDAADRNNPKVTARAGNREWHVIATSATLARRFRSHIEEDFKQSGVLGGTPESIETEVLVDVPLRVLEAAALEAAPARVLDRLPIKKTVRVKPLLTPDREGAVYCRAVLALIRSAKKQLLFQIPYINMKGADGGFLGDLVGALVDRSQTIDDCRIILRSGSDVLFNVSQLKRRGMDVNTCVRRLTNTHTKGMIVDGRQVLVGSHNWSSAGVTLNRDASLLFDDVQIAQYYAEAFEIDWERASELTFDEAPAEEAPRPAAGDAPPPGFVRMTLADYLEG